MAEENCGNPFCRIHGKGSSGLQQILSAVLGHDVVVLDVSAEQARQIHSSSSAAATDFFNEVLESHTSVALKDVIVRHEFRTKLIRRYLADAQAWADLIAEPLSPTKIGEAFVNVFDVWREFFILTWEGLVKAQR